MNKSIQTSDAYTRLKEHTDAVYSQQAVYSPALVRDLLADNGIKLRQRDGRLVQTTVSVPLSEPGIVVGLRYIKSNGDPREDLFLFRPNEEIVLGYKGGLERRLPEYTGTHTASPY